MAIFRLAIQCTETATSCFRCPTLHTELLCIPEDPFFMSDGSWFDDGKCGGCFVVGSMQTYEYRLYEVDIPLYLDHSFAVELYVAWTVLRARHGSLNRPEGHWVTKASSYTDCLSYVLVLESSNQQRTPLIHRLLMDCRAMSTSFTAPRHIHSHRSGTVIDGILDAVDAGAKHAHRQRPRCGWICQLDEPQVNFSVQDKQKHDFHSFLERSVSKLFCHARHVVYAPYDTGTISMKRW